MSDGLRYQLWLHVIVLIWGFTAILGKLISLPAVSLVWYRILIAVVGLFLLLRWQRVSLAMKRRDAVMLGGTGLIVALHWVCFFQSIKLSTVSVALVCLSSCSFFTAIIEPLIFRRHVRVYELFFGVIAIAGLYVIFQFESGYLTGALFGIASAALSSLFTVLNGSFVRRLDSRTIAFYEMAGGFAGMCLYVAATRWWDPAPFAPTPSDILYLLILGLVCTAYAFVSAVSVMRLLSPFTVSLTVNLEPIYGIVLALLIFGEEERMTPQFYVGTAIILTTIFGNVYLKRRRVEGR